MGYDISHKLKQLRKIKGLTQYDVANKLNTTRATISNYERNARNPNLTDLQRLAKIYGVGLEYFNTSAPDEITELVTRAKDVFTDNSISADTKDKLYFEFMQLYLQTKKAG